MSDYYAVHRYGEDELEHASEGWTKKGAKYISRIKKNGKWVYQYADKKLGLEYNKNKKKYSEELTTAAKNANNANAKAYKIASKYNSDQQIISRFPTITSTNTDLKTGESDTDLVNRYYGSKSRAAKKAKAELATMKADVSAYAGNKAIAKQQSQVVEKAKSE